MIKYWTNHLSNLVTLIDQSTGGESKQKVSKGEIYDETNSSSIYLLILDWNWICRFKFEFQKLIGTERTRMGQTHLKFLREFDCTEEKVRSWVRIPLQLRFSQWQWIDIMGSNQLAINHTVFWAKITNLVYKIIGSCYSFPLVSATTKFV